MIETKDVDLLIGNQDFTERNCKNFTKATVDTIVYYAQDSFLLMFPTFITLFATH